MRISSLGGANRAVVGLGQRSGVARLDCGRGLGVQCRCTLYGNGALYAMPSASSFRAFSSVPHRIQKWESDTAWSRSCDTGSWRWRSPQLSAPESVPWLTLSDMSKNALCSPASVVRCVPRVSVVRCVPRMSVVCEHDVTSVRRGNRASDASRHVSDHHQLLQRARIRSISCNSLAITYGCHTSESHMPSLSRSAPRTFRCGFCQIGIASPQIHRIVRNWSSKARE
jgi:hypothetical protein